MVASVALALWRTFSRFLSSPIITTRVPFSLLAGFNKGDLLQSHGKAGPPAVQADLCRALWVEVLVFKVWSSEFRVLAWAALAFRLKGLLVPVRAAQHLVSDADLGSRPRPKTPRLEGHKGLRDCL